MKGKTALLVATAEGWPEIVTTLLYGYNASVNEKVRICSLLIDLVAARAVHHWILH